jgi:hypothetical protein
MKFHGCGHCTTVHSLLQPPTAYILFTSCVSFRRLSLIATRSILSNASKDIMQNKFIFGAHFSNARCHLLCNLHSDDNRIFPRAEAGKDVVNAGFRSENVA